MESFAAGEKIRMDGSLLMLGRGLCWLRGRQKTGGGGRGEAGQILKEKKNREAR